MHPAALRATCLLHLGLALSPRPLFAAQDGPASETPPPDMAADATKAGATKTGLSVTWRGPKECGSPSQLEDLTRELLGDEIPPGEVTVVARGARLTDGRYRVDLKLSGQIEGVRRLESSRCDEAIQAAAVVIALAVNPNALMQASGRDEKKEPPPPVPPPKNPSVIPAEPERDLRFVAFVGARVSGGIAPAPSFGAHLSLGVEVSWFRAQLDGFVEPNQSLALPNGREAIFKSAGGGALVCGKFLTKPRVSARACTGVTVNAVTAHASGLVDSESQTAWIVSPLVGPALDVALHPNLSLALGMYFQIPTSYPTFSINRPGEADFVVHEVGLGGVGNLGFEFHF